MTTHLRANVGPRATGPLDIVGIDVVAAGHSRERTQLHPRVVICGETAAP